MTIRSSRADRLTATGALVFRWAGLPLRVGCEPVFRQLMAYGAPLAIRLGIESILDHADQVTWRSEPVAPAVPRGPAGDW